MNIRLAKKSDTGALISLLREVLSIHHEIRRDIFKPNGTKYRESELTDILENKKTPVFVAEIDTRVVGYCFTSINEQEESNIMLARKELYIDDLCVDQNMRGEGIGRALYQYAEQYARDIGCHSITLNVWEGNDDAISFYKRMELHPRKTLMEKIL